MSKNTKILIGAVAVLAVIAALLVMFLLGMFGSDGDTGEGGTAGGSVSGTINYMVRMALPDDAVVRLAIVNSATRRPLSNITLRNVGQVPIAFEIPYNPSQVEENQIYLVDATIEDGGGTAMFVTRQNYPVITQGNPTRGVEVMVEPATPVEPTATPVPGQAFITINTPLQGAVVDIAGPFEVSGRGAGLPEGNVVVEALDRDGNVLAQQPTIVDTAEVGGEGPWAVELTVNTEPGMVGKIRAYSLSPADNSLIAESVVEVSFGRTEAKPVFIQIEEPLSGAVLNIDRPVKVRGTGGGLPENNVVVQALDRNGNVLAQQPTTVKTDEVGGQGPWEVELAGNVAPGTPGQIRAFSSSPADNSVLAESRVDVTYGQPPANVPPTAVIEGPNEAFVGDTVTFQGGKSRPGSSPIVVYSWNFGNTRSSNDTPDISASTVYDQPGRYDVSLTVRDQNGLENSDTMQINIKERAPDVVPPTAVINVPNQIEVGQPATFDGRASTPGNGGNIVRYDWDFGDGSKASGPTANYTYQNAGTFNVTLFVTDAAGQSGSSAINVNVSEGQQPPPGGGLEGINWTLTGTPAGVTITARFENGGVSGSSGCNTYTGNYTINGQNITISGFTASQLVCDDALMAAEQTYLQALQSASTFQVSGSSLTINVTGGALNYTQ
ncbi:MAG: hypothetical protein Kow0031_27450 [Anaerolineae bacterium]